MICEVRIPTYRRPRLLERALRSLQAQTHTDWRGIVMDDCPEGSARPVVDSIADQRIIYRHNAQPLGAIGNIDTAFRNRPFADGAVALVLEDDNYLLPEHIAEQIGTCASHGVAVVLSAQWVEEIEEPGAPGRLTDKKTLAWIYSEGRHPFRTLLPAVLFSHAFSNGAAFWRIGCDTDFEIGAITRRPGVQETLRTLKLRDDVYVSHHATAVWRSNDPRDSYVNPAAAERVSDRLRARWRALAERREISDYRDWYIAQYGLSDAMLFSGRSSGAHAPALERAILMSGRYVALTDSGLAWRLVQIAKGHAFRSLVGRKLDMEMLSTESAALRSH